MNTLKQRRPIRLAPAVALGFFILGIMSLVASLSILLIHPSITSGDPYRLEVLALGVLVSFGFVGSFVFGAAYIISPVMASGSLYSERLAVLHFFCHLGGLGILTIVFAGMSLIENPQSGFYGGIGLVLLGALIHIYDLLVTASRHNRWEPEQFTLLAAYFWLCITTVLGLSLLMRPWIPMAWDDTLQLLEAHAPLGMIGFIWLSLLGFSLKLFNMFLLSEKSAGALSWCGWVLINISLMAFVPVLLFWGGRGIEFVTAVVSLGSLCYLLDIMRLWMAARRPLDWALTSAFIGLLSGFVLFGWVLAGTPLMVEDAASVIRENARVFFVVGVFGTVSVTLLGLAVRLIPFLVWQLRCAPYLSVEAVLSPKDLERRGSGLAMLICFAASWVYLAVGQWAQNPVGTQIGAISMLCGLYWFMWSLKPALSLFVFGTISNK